jgi:hypothetical protein
MLKDVTDIDVISTIEKAFKDTPKPRNITMRIARAIDDYWDVDPSECQRLRELDNDNDWRDIPDKLVEKYCDIFHFLDADGFRYYLPRFMVWTIRRYGSSRLGNPDSFMYCMDPDFDKEDIHWNYLSPEQKYAYVLFLKYYYINIALSDEKDKLQPVLQKRCIQIGYTG